MVHIITPPPLYPLSRGCNRHIPCFIALTPYAISKQVHPSGSWNFLHSHQGVKMAAAAGGGVETASPFYNSTPRKIFFKTAKLREGVRVGVYF